MIPNAADVFLLQPANRPILDGKRRLPVGLAKPGTLIVGAIPFILTIGGVVLIIVALREERNFDRLQARGAHAVATVTTLHSAEGPGDSRDPDMYWANYEYKVDGRTYAGTAGLDWFEYTDLSEGSRLEIRYDPEDASVSKLEKRFPERERDGPVGIRSALGAFIAMTVIAALWFAGWYFAQLRPLQRLKRQGRILHGTLVNCSGRCNDDDYLAAIEYRFTDPSGMEVVGRAEAERNDLKASPPPTSGTEVVVYFVDAATYVLL